MIAVGRASRLHPNQIHQVRLHGKPYVLYKDQLDRIHFFSDTCLHRGMSLSKGKIVSPDGCLECPYHGWLYKSDSFCLPTSCVPETRPVEMTVKEKDDIVWVSRDVESHPIDVPYWEDGDYAKVHFEVTLEQSAQLIIENGIDPSHASWVHANAFGFGVYKEEAQNVRMISDNGIAFEYKPNPFTLPAMLLGFNKTHNVHYYELPYTTWSEVVISGGVKLMTFVTLVPETESRTRMMVVFARNFLRSKIFDAMFVIMGRVIVEQDRQVLENVDRSFESEGILVQDDVLIKKYREDLARFR